MKSVFLYFCGNPDCRTSHVPASLIRKSPPPRCHACGYVTRETTVYKPVTA